MSSRIPGVLLLAALALCGPRCAGDADVVVGRCDLTSSISGNVRPVGPDITVHLVRGDDTVATTNADPESGGFVFSDVAYGRKYTVIAVGEEATGSSYVRTERSLETVGVFMEPEGWPIKNLDFHDGDTITSMDLAVDSVIRIRIELKPDFVLREERPLAVRHPGSLTGTEPEEVSFGRILVAAFETEKLFAARRTAFTIYFSKAGKSANPAADSVTLTYFIDSTALDSTLTRLLLGSGFRDTVTIDREEAIPVVFARQMNRPSVENAVTVSPSFQPNFFWSNTTLRIQPANTLAESTVYTVTIDTSAMTRDSAMFRRPVHIRAVVQSRAFFREYWPLDGADSVSLVAPFHFDSPYSLDPELLRGAFSIRPEVDSLEFSSPEHDGRVEITHAMLLPDTNYTITVSDSLRSLLGTPLERELTITFQTDEAGS